MLGHLFLILLLLCLMILNKTLLASNLGSLTEILSFFLDCRQGTSSIQIILYSFSFLVLVLLLLLRLFRFLFEGFYKFQVLLSIFGCLFLVFFCFSFCCTVNLGGVFSLGILRFYSLFSKKFVLVIFFAGVIFGVTIGVVI